MIVIQTLCSGDAPRLASMRWAAAPQQYKKFGLELARAAGVKIILSVWEGMSHLLQSSFNQFRTAERSVNAIVEFMGQRLEDVVPSTALKGH